MDIGNTFELNNGLFICVDWIEFTVFNDMSPIDVINVFGLNSADFQDGLKGGNGYKSRLRHGSYGISVMYDGNDDMGIHVTVPGMAVRYFLECYYEKHLEPTPFGPTGYPVDSFDNCTVLSDVLKDIMDLGQLTRLDLAIDDKGCIYYGLDELSKIFENRLYVSRFKTYKETVERGKEQKTGHTIYLGSRKSAMMVRIYDKKLEQNKENLDNPVSFEWTRWELELHKERAQAVAVLLVGGAVLSDIAIGVLSHYLRLIINDNERDTRCSTADKWSAFLDGIKSIRICQPVRVKTLEDKRDWLKKQVGPTLAALYEIDCDLGFIFELIENGSLRLSQELQNIIREEQRKQGYDFTDSF